MQGCTTSLRLVRLQDMHARLATVPWCLALPGPPPGVSKVRSCKGCHPSGRRAYPHWTLTTGAGLHLQIKRSWRERRFEVPRGPRRGKLPPCSAVGFHPAAWIQRLFLAEIASLPIFPAVDRLRFYNQHHGGSLSGVAGKRNHFAGHHGGSKSTSLSECWKKLASQFVCHVPRARHTSQIVQGGCTTCGWPQLMGSTRCNAPQLPPPGDPPAAAAASAFGLPDATGDLLRVRNRSFPRSTVSLYRSLSAAQRSTAGAVKHGWVDVDTGGWNGASRKCIGPPFLGRCGVACCPRRQASIAQKSKHTLAGRYCGCLAQPAQRPSAGPRTLQRQSPRALGRPLFPRVRLRLRFPHFVHLCNTTTAQR